jgi:hypothetical protein
METEMQYGRVENLCPAGVVAGALRAGARVAQPLFT